MTAYPGVRWHLRCVNMRPCQVIAVFKAMQGKKLKGYKPIKKKEETKQDEFHQIDMFEYLQTMEEE